MVVGVVVEVVVVAAAARHLPADAQLLLVGLRLLRVRFGLLLRLLDRVRTSLADVAALSALLRLERQRRLRQDRVPRVVRQQFVHVDAVATGGEQEGVVKGEAGADLLRVGVGAAPPILVRALGGDRHGAVDGGG